MDAISLHSWPRCDYVYHKMFLDVMMEASRSYKPDSSYISDILTLKTECLLCDAFAEEKETANMMELQRYFKKHIRTFIQSKKLKGPPVCSYFLDLVVCIVPEHTCISMYGMYLQNTNEFIYQSNLVR